MTLADLNADQLKVIADSAARRRDYLRKVQQRMQELRFPIDDRLFKAILREWEAASDVCVVASTALNKRPMMERKPWAG
ncbi:MAG TPA: hypothetical protein VH518_11595 [Tepidisphaeraceae bacterium]|jgi:hypothetical protein